MRESFSTNTKKELLIEQKLKRCCTFSLIYGFSFLMEEENGEFVLKKANAENADFIIKAICSVLKNKVVYYNKKSKEIRLNKEIVRFSTFAEYKSHVFKCEACEGAFLKAIFLSCGTVCDPTKDYRLDMTFKDEKKRDELFTFLCELGFQPKRTTRKDVFIIYFRGSEQIENLLAKIGAVNATFAIMNSKIFKEVTNNVNRVANCDNANISKALKASEKYIDAISNLIELGLIEQLPEQLRKTALKRIEFRELNFEQLGKKFSPPISKSGIYHRLEKILNFYENYDKSFK